MMTKLQMFYHSRQWEAFIKRLRIERVNSTGMWICEHCGKPIIKAYDCIAHHKQELTADNVDDVNISLNPDNIMLVHFKCHNELHKRFGFGEGQPRIIKQVFVVYGAPCSGKTTWVKSVAAKEDIVLDIDRLWGAIRAECCTTYEKPNELTSNVFALRDCIIDMIKVRRGRWHNAYIIGGYPLQGERERIVDRVGAIKTIFIDTPKEVCLVRAKLKSSEWVGYVETWFDRYTPPVV